jgi:hypothetical protein
MLGAQSKNTRSVLLTLLLALLLTVAVAGPSRAMRTTFRVVGAGAEAVPGNFVGTCPGVITFKAKLQATQAGRVKYQWIRSDGATGPVEYVDFTEAGVMHVETTWTLGDLSALPTFVGWEQIKVISPNTTVSNKANFKLTCTQPSKPGDDDSDLHQ